MPPAEITRAETSKRARLLRVRDYDVTLDLTGGPDAFGSTCVIRFDCTEPGAASYADLIAADVAEISLNGTQLDPAGWADGRIALPGLAASNELRVVARCRYSTDGTGMHRSVDPADGRIYAYTKFEPAYARTVFANFEQPDLKAVFTTHVTAPAGWTVLSNQPQAGRRSPTVTSRPGTSSRPRGCRPISSRSSRASTPWCAAATRRPAASRSRSGSRAASRWRRTRIQPTCSP